MHYPDTPTGDQIDTLHGTVVADPYRWLEDVDDDRTRAWVAAQQAVTSDWLDRASGRDAIHARLTALWDHPRRGAPWRHGARWFQLRNSGLQAQQVLWTMPAPDADGRVVLDPNRWTTDGTAALTGLAISADGSTVAYARSDQGSDWQTWRVRRTDRSNDEPDVVSWSKFSGAAWAPDGAGFWYGAYERPAEGQELAASNRGQQLAFHRSGRPQSDDEVVVANPDDSEWMFEPAVSDDGRWLIVTVTQGTDPRTRLHVADLHGDGRVAPLLDDFDAEYRVVGTVGSTLYVLTDRDAPSRRVVAIAVDRPAPDAWRSVVAASDDTIESARVVGGRVAVVRLHHASHRLTLHGLDGGAVTTVELADHGSVTSVTGRSDDAVLHLTHGTWTRPSTVIAHDIASGRTSELFVQALPTDGVTDADVRTTQVFVPRDDGVAIPMFLVHRADVTPDHDTTPARTVLYGYGGFGISITPAFSVSWRVWVERGGVVAVANLRGGGEYGQSWHDAGRLDNKQQVFDDAIACAQWLTACGWTTPERLAVQGASNGGLLAGACLTQRPDLFGAAVVQVGVLDMLRFHRFTIGWAWISDYGDPDDPDQFRVLHAYSPLHRISAGTDYPATMIVTGDHDDRVVPGHSFKFAAALQAAQAGDAPVLLRVASSAGHGAGTPTALQINERADILAFCETVLDHQGDPV